MQDFSYWRKQEPNAPLFPDILWQRPEQKALAGKLLIIGGSAHGFAAVAAAHKSALAAGAGECRVVLPDALKKSIDPAAYDCFFVPTNLSGGLSKDSLPKIQAACSWADAILLIGDAGRNSETAIVYEQLATAETLKPLIITRDAFDLLKGSWGQLLEKKNTVLIVTLAQLQKLFQAVYFPKTILFSMQLTNLAEALHKFTITYPAALTVFHSGQLLAAQDGEVVSHPWEEPLLIWRGDVAAKAAVLAMQSAKSPSLLPAIATSFLPNM